MSRLRIDNLRAKGVDAKHLVVGDGQCAAIHGPSGSGKTLLLRAIADLDQAEGEVWLDDKARSHIDAPDWRRQVMYLAAESHWWHPQVREHAPAWDSATLNALGFDDAVIDWDVQRLSSGERQRLALARALAHAPWALLLDEPSANLDGQNTDRVENVIAEWRARTAGCALWVSHDPAQRRRVASASYVIDAGTLREQADEQ